MANTKISALPLVSTPLAGTEVLPIVQGGITEQVATNDLTVRNVRANATTGILQVTGPTAASTRVMTTPDANFTVARTDAAQSFTGDQTLSTGNLVIGTSGKGIDFTATSGSGTSELLADYEEGTWTPNVGGTATYSLQSGTYTKVGRLVHVTGSMVINAIGTGSATTISGLPFASIGSPADFVGFSNFSSAASSVVYLAGSADGSSQILIRSLTAAATGVSTNNIFQNGTRVDFAGTYETT
jgi:hypothetical protein